jgi:hypothetical protein
LKPKKAAGVGCLFRFPEEQMGRFAIALPLVVMLFGETTLQAITSSAQEKRLLSQMTLLDRAAASRAGEEAVLAGLTRTFSTTRDRIVRLRAAKLGFGEIAATLAMADALDGGLNETNLNRVAGLRQGKAGWVQIARAFDLDLGSVSRKVGAVLQDARVRGGKAAGERSGSGAGTGAWCTAGRVAVTAPGETGNASGRPALRYT